MSASTSAAPLAATIYDSNDSLAMGEVSDAVDDDNITVVDNNMSNDDNETSNDDNETVDTMFFVPPGIS